LYYYSLWYRPLSTCMLYGCLQRVTIPGKGKAVPLQAWSGPEGSMKLRFPDFMTTTIPEAVVIQFVLLRISRALLETC